VEPGIARLHLPPDLRDWLPDGHLAWFILDVTDQLDLQPFYRAHRDDGHGHPAYDPRLLLGVLLYAGGPRLLVDRQPDRDRRRAGAADPLANHARQGKPRKDGKPSASKSDGLRAVMTAKLNSEEGKARYTYGAWLSRQGYTPVSVRFQLQLLAHVSRWLASQGLGAAGLTSAAVASFAASRRAAGYTNYRSPKALAPLLGYLRGLGGVPLPPAAAPASRVEALLERYHGYLTGQRGLAWSTARDYVVRANAALDTQAADATWPANRAGRPCGAVRSPPPTSRTRPQGRPC